MGNTGSKGGSSGSGGSGNKGNSNNDKNSRAIGMWGVGESKTVYSNNGGGNIFTNTGKPYYESYPSNTTSKGGEGSISGKGSISGGGGVGSQSGVFDHRFHQLHPRDAETFIERIKASESEIQKLVNQYRPLNPKSNEESLRVCAIITLGIATDKELEGLKNYKIEQEKALAINAPMEHRLISQSPHDYSRASSEDIDKHFAWAFDNTNGRLDINGFLSAGNTAVLRITEHLGHLTNTHAEHVLRHKKVLNFSFNLMNDKTVEYLSKFLYYLELHLDELNLKANCISDVGVEFLFYQLRNAFDVRIHEIKSINLSGNNIGDYGALYITESFKSARYPYLKSLDLSNNNITDTGAAHLAQSFKSEGNKLNIIHVEGNKIGPKGEKYFVTELLDKATQHMIIYTQSHKGQFDEHIKMIFGNKEERATVYKKLIAQGVEKGINVEAIVVDQTLLGKINNGIDLTTTNIKTFFGFIKCNFDPIDMVKSYATDKIIAKLPKSVSKLMGEIKTTEGAVSCYFEAHNEAWTSESGLNVLTHELCVNGENGFCGE